MLESPDRREFLVRAAAVIPLMHLGGMSPAPPAPPHPGSSARTAHMQRARFARLRLRCADTEELLRFYRDTLELTVERAANDAIEVRFGETVIEFTKSDDGSQPYYHFALNIPHNTLDTAVIWMRHRCPLVQRADGSVIFHFESWNAHAIYFIDPAGNIVEFIARHTLSSDPRYVGTPTWFDSSHMLCASEIGVVAPDVASAAAKLKTGLDLPTYHGSSEEFHAVGDEHGLFIVVKTGRRWFSSDRAAEVFPAEAVVRSDTPPTEPLELAGSMFRVSRR
jgi:catechol-2,3-dioxygenase